VLFASGTVGVNVAVRLAASYRTLAAIADPPAGVNVKLNPVKVDASIARENVALTADPTGTAVAPAAGDFAVTVGAAFTVVKVQETELASATPSAAFTVVSRVAV